MTVEGQVVNEIGPLRCQPDNAVLVQINTRATKPLPGLRLAVDRGRRPHLTDNFQQERCSYVEPIVAIVDAPVPGLEPYSYGRPRASVPTGRPVHTPERSRAARPIQSLALRPLLSVNEAAILLGQSRSALYRSIHAGDVPFRVVRMAGRYRIPRRAVERFLEGE